MPAARVLPPPDRGPVAGLRSARVGAARRLRRPAERREQGRFLVEGAQAVGAAVAAGGLLEVFVGVSAAGRHDDLLRAAAVPVRLVTDEAAAALSETVTPRGSSPSPPCRVTGSSTWPHPDWWRCAWARTIRATPAP